MSQDRQRAARYVVARRGELNLTQQGLAKAASVDMKTIYNLESGDRWPRPTTRARLEAALRWQPGDLSKIAAGGEPAIAEAAAAPEGTAEPEIPERLARNERFMKLLDQMAPEERRAHLEIINELWRRGQQRAEEDVEGYVERAITGLTG